MMTFENVKFHEYLVCKSDNCHMALLLRTPGHFDSLLEVGLEESRVTLAKFRIFCNGQLSASIGYFGLDYKYF